MTWSQSRITNVEEFYRKLVELVPDNTELFGCQEFHEDGRPHYHAVIKFADRPWWRNARERLMMSLESGEVDTKAIRFRLPYKYQTEEEFLKNTQGYCSKEDPPITFGKWIEPGVVARKRKWAEVLEEPNRDEAKRMMKEIDPHGFVKHYPAYMAYLDGEKRKTWSLKGVGGEFAMQPWKVPKKLEKWRQRYIVERDYHQRPVPLILVGASRLGKTEWAMSAGERPLVMTAQ